MKAADKKILKEALSLALEAHLRADLALLMATSLRQAIVSTFPKIETDYLERMEMLPATNLAKTRIEKLLATIGSMDEDALGSGEAL
jgi:hypothetical protein